MIRAITERPDNIIEHGDIWMYKGKGSEYNFFRYSASDGMWTQKSFSPRWNVMKAHLTPMEMESLTTYLEIWVNGKQFLMVDTTIYEICKKYDVESNFTLELKDNEHAQFLLSYI